MNFLQICTLTVTTLELVLTLEIPNYVKSTNTDSLPTYIPTINKRSSAYKRLPGWSVYYGKRSDQNVISDNNNSNKNEIKQTIEEFESGDSNVFKDVVKEWDTNFENDIDTTIDPSKRSNYKRLQTWYAAYGKRNALNANDKTLTLTKEILTDDDNDDIIYTDKRSPQWFTAYGKRSPLALEVNPYANVQDKQLNYGDPNMSFGKRMAEVPDKRAAKWQVTYGKRAPNWGITYGKRDHNWGVTYGKRAPNWGVTYGKRAPNWGVTYGKRAPNWGVTYGKRAPNWGVTYGKRAHNWGVTYGKRAHNWGVTYGKRAPNWGVTYGKRAPNWGVTYGKRDSSINTENHEPLSNFAESEKDDDIENIDTGSLDDKLPMTWFPGYDKRTHNVLSDM